MYDRVKDQSYQPALQGGGHCYVGICSDEKERYDRLVKKYANASSPAYEHGLTESDCMNIATSLNLVSPVYKSSTRDGCFFCPKQPVNSLRALREKHPELWNKMLKWDESYPLKGRTGFKLNHTVKEYNQRFDWEKQNPDKKFKWKFIDKP